jgi:hypothetical protein
MQVINVPTNIGFFLKKSLEIKIVQTNQFYISSKGKYTYFEIYIS